MIVGAQGLSLKFTGYECVKWLESTELHRPRPPVHRPGHPPPPPPFDPIAAIPPGQLFNSDVTIFSIREWRSQIASHKAIRMLTLDLNSLEHQQIVTIKWDTMRLGICSQDKKWWSTTAQDFLRASSHFPSASRPLKDGLLVSATTLLPKRESSSTIWPQQSNHYLLSFRSKAVDKSSSGTLSNNYR